MNMRQIFLINRDSVTAFTTKDGSTIREILSPTNSPAAIRRQSLAEATVLPGMATDPHFHPVTEEIYYILSGTGQFQIKGASCEVRPGDGIAIPPGTVHTIKNTGVENLVFLCCCAPAYTHEDTVMASLSEDDGETSQP